MIRYLDQPDKEHWPSGFSGRYHLCTCPAHPDAEAKDAAFAQALTELREFLDQGTWWQQLRSGMWEYRRPTPEEMAGYLNQLH